MTIRLLCAYDKYPANAIVTLDAGTEAGLIAANQATATLTGGTAYASPAPALQASIRAASRPRVSKVLLVGDSIGAWHEVQIAMPGVCTDNGDGTFLIPFASDKGFYAGDPIRVTAATEARYNVIDGVVASATGAGPINVYFSQRVSPALGGAGSGVAARALSRTACGFLSAYSFFAKQKINWVQCAAGGSKIADALKMLADSGVGSGDADLAMVMVGTNNLYAGGQTAAQVIAEYGPLFDRLQTLATPVVVFLVPPRTSGTSATVRGHHATVNRWLWDECLRRGFRPVDTWRASWNGQTMIDSASATAAPTAGMLQSDGTHGDIPAGMAWGKAAYAATGDLLAVGSWVASSASLLTALNNVLVASGLDVSFAAGGGTAVPGAGTITNNTLVPLGMTLQHTSGSPTAALALTARTVAADGDALGNKLSMTFSGITGATSTRLSRAALQTYFTPGQRVRLRMPIAFSSLAGCTNLSARLWPTVAADGFVHYSAMTLGNVSQFGGADTGVLETPVFTIPAGGLSACEIRLDIAFANGGSGLIETWQPEIVLEQ